MKNINNKCTISARREEIIFNINPPKIERGNAMQRKLSILCSITTILMMIPHAKRRYKISMYLIFWIDCLNIILA